MLETSQLDFDLSFLDDLAEYQAFEPRWILCDGNGLMFPFFSLGLDAHGTAEAVTASVDKLMQRWPTGRIVMCWDAVDNRAFRRQWLPCYKFGRGAARSSLFRDQIEATYRLGQEKGYLQLTRAGYEADDVIASAVRLFVQESVGPVVIVSEDQDLLQLVQPAVVQLHPRKRLLMDASALELAGKFGGFDHTWRKAIKGDGGDNVKGLPGVGDVWAGTILQEYPDFVAHCIAGTVDFYQFTPKARLMVMKAGLALAHPVKVKHDTCQPDVSVAERAVMELVRDTYQSIALEDGLTFDALTDAVLAAKAVSP